MISTKTLHHKLGGRQNPLGIHRKPILNLSTWIFCLVKKLIQWSCLKAFRINQPLSKMNPNLSRSLFCQGIEPFSLPANQYDDDYAADYHLPEDDGYHGDTVLIDSDSNKKSKAKQIEPIDKIQKPDHNDQSGRATLILNRLKKLSTEFLERKPGGITKVMGTGLKNTKLELNDCVSVLKAAGLLELIDGFETGLDSTGKPKSRYFLVKADLLDGK